MVVIYKVNDRLSKGIPHKHVVFVDMCYKSQLIENLSGYYSSFSLRSISGSEGWKEFWSPHCHGVWPPLCKKGMDRLMPLIQDFSSISNSDPQKINFTLQYTYTHKHTHTQENISYHYSTWPTHTYFFYSSIQFYYIFKLLLSYHQLDFMISNGSWTTAWKILS